MTRVFLVCALISLFCRFANAYPGGAPDGTCTTMAPSVAQHGAGPQTTNAPYMIQADKAYYNQSSKITVTVKGIGNATIRGILIQARNMGKDKPLGKFTMIPQKTKYLDCTGSYGAENEQGAVTHSESLGTAKILTFEWKPTDMTTGDIYFMATIVESKATYWVKVKSDKLQDMTTPTSDGTKSNAAVSIALLILAISAKLFI